MTMRRSYDPLVLVCTAISVLCTIVTVVVVAPTVLKTSSDTDDNCARIHQLVLTLDTLIASGREQSKAYEREGTITKAQLERALRENDKSRAKLGEADCPPRLSE